MIGTRCRNAGRTPRLRQLRHCSLGVVTKVRQASRVELWVIPPPTNHVRHMPKADIGRRGLRSGDRHQVVPTGLSEPYSRANLAALIFSNGLGQGNRSVDGGSVRFWRHNRTEEPFSSRRICWLKPLAPGFSTLVPPGFGEW